ncbi:MAG: UDP-N-acetylglucosamine--N-acetylmuramyl-(pentapeptide) pyrophosphoryl-undecaprenol N-acetylglucosamine transferase [Planctomycetota bacterium]|nr:UDP-N-acetylglucosamine--N-acetylmuramyl-(pentapeptide) pyrophosphoryl-undecaprenol N-acetylglucosamine transferase [Planctomycetota bacterium]
MKRILLAGGNSGGHIFPGLALARALSEQGVGQPLFLDHQTPMERKILPDCGIERISPPWSGIGTIGDAFLRVLPARRWLAHHRIDAVIALGARPAVAVGIAAWTTRLPLFLLEQNKVMGRANQCLSRIARKVFLTWPIDGMSRSLRSRSAILGCPVREQFVASPLKNDPKPQLLIMGGSQGSEPVNQMILETAERLKNRRTIRVHHICGDEKTDGIQQRWNQLGIDAEVRSFIEEPAQTLIDSSLVLGRSGGSIVAEVCCVGRPAIYWPYRHRDHHQLENARHVSASGGALVVEQESPAQIAQWIDDLIENRSRLEQMADSARSLGCPAAARRIADVIASHLGADQSGSSGHFEEVVEVRR